MLATKLESSVEHCPEKAEFIRRGTEEGKVSRSEYSKQKRKPGFRVQ